jgi:hypothetical protein
MEMGCRVSPVSDATTAFGEKARHSAHHINALKDVQAA